MGSPFTEPGNLTADPGDYRGDYQTATTDWAGSTLPPLGRPTAQGTTLLPPGTYNNTHWDNLTRSTSVPGFISISNISFEEGVYLPLWDNLTSCDLNGTLCYTADAGNSTLVTPLPPGEPPKYWAVVLTLFPLLTVFGNVLVCMGVYRERALQTVTNYFIVSLAVADIMVAVLVMPLAIYVEVLSGKWSLGNALCDTWVALDVMCCTASILNLTAISVDRFIAVTQPIKYAKHKNSKRVHVMLAITWVISLAISSPIALGMNYTTRRSETPYMCIFYNADFLIYSSMGSFYIPCVIMILLYWRIFRAIHLRAKKVAKQKALSRPRASAAPASKVIENRAQTHIIATTTTSDASATEDAVHRELLPARGLNSLRAGGREHGTIAEETSFTNFNARMSTTEQDDTEHEEGTPLDGAPKSPNSDHSGGTVIPNTKSTDFMLSPTSDEGAGHVVVGGSRGYSAPATVEVVANAGARSPNSPLSPSPPGHPLPSTSPSIHNNNHSRLPSTNTRNNNVTPSPKKSVTKFNFHLRHSKKRKDRSTTRRERKATKTLAIVLGCFLFCWVPFFTINIISAICIRYNLFESRAICNIHPMLFSFFVWLGYINSFLNPVIYTIFNIEFRRAFKKILSDTCL